MSNIIVLDKAISSSFGVSNTGRSTIFVCSRRIPNISIGSSFSNSIPFLKLCFVRVSSSLFLHIFCWSEVCYNAALWQSCHSRAHSRASTQSRFDRTTCLSSDPQQCSCSQSSVLQGKHGNQHVLLFLLNPHAFWINQPCVADDHCKDGRVHQHVPSYGFRCCWCCCHCYIQDCCEGNHHQLCLLVLCFHFFVIAPFISVVLLCQCYRFFVSKSQTRGIPWMFLDFVEIGCWRLAKIWSWRVRDCLCNLLHPSEEAMETPWIDRSGLLFRCDASEQPL